MDEAGNETTCNFDILVNEYVGIETLKEAEISIYPNPTSGKLNLKIDKHYSKLKISIFTTSGEKISTFLNQTEMDISSFSKGTYVITIEIDDKMKTKKIIKIE